MPMKAGKNIDSVTQNYRKSIPSAQELRVIRGTKTHELCRVCANIFTDHAKAQCPVGPGF